MNSKSFPFPVFLILLRFLLLIPLSSAAFDYEWFFNCNEISSPLPPTEFHLWRNNDTGNCAHYESMKVNYKESLATIEVLGEKHQLLVSSMKAKMIIIAEIDFSSRFCSPDHNISSSSIYAIIPVSYDCGHHQNPDRSSTCSRVEASFPPFENKTPNAADAYCISAVVPIPPLLLNKLGDLQALTHHIKTVFDPEKQVDAQICRSCSVLDGVCGYDLLTYQTRCYCQSQSPTEIFEVCPHHPYAKTPEKADAPKTEPASDEREKPKKTTPLIIEVSIGGACLVATILGCCFFYCLRRKKKHPIIEESTSKESHFPAAVGSDPLSNKDIPPYPSSKSDHDRATTNHGIIQVFTYAELEKATDNFNPSRELGDGGFGTVYYGKLVDGRKVAVKRLYENNCKRVEQFINEVDILAHLQHKNLVKLYGCTSRFSQGLLLVYKYIPNATVADHLHGSRANFGLLSWPIRLRIVTETADALAYLHHSEIIHRDVKTNNILLDNNFTVKVADFGLSRLFPTDVTHVSTAPQGTPGYVDPEYYQCYQLTTKSDVYSFGVVLIELISSLRAVDTDRKRHDINLSNMAVSKIQSGALNELIDPKLGFDKNHEARRAITIVAELAFRCLQQERDLRPSMEEVVEVLREIENDKSSPGIAKVVDIGVVGDDIEPTKRTPPSFSPNSVIANNWVSSSSTTNSL